MLKFQSATKLLFLADLQKIYNLIFSYNYLIYHKVWLKSDEKKL